MPVDTSTPLVEAAELRALANFIGIAPAVLAAACQLLIEFDKQRRDADRRNFSAYSRGLGGT